MLPHPPRGWVSRLPPAPQTLQLSPILPTVCTVSGVTQSFSSFRKRFRCRRYQERSVETKSSRCPPGPSAVVTTSKRGGEAPTKPGLISEPITSPCQLQREETGSWIEAVRN